MFSPSAGGKALDDVTVSTFISFVNDDLTQLIDPEEILDAKTFADIEKRLKALAKGKGGGKRVDRLATICTRLFILLTSEGYEPAKSHTENLVSFMLSKVIPNDLQTSLYMDLTKNGSDPIKEMLQ